MSLACPKCGYVRGATTGYEPLTPEERKFLEGRGYTLRQNVHGDELARLPDTLFNAARHELHQALCVARETLPRCKTRFDHILQGARDV